MDIILSSVSCHICSSCTFTMSGNVFIRFLQMASIFIWSGIVWRRIRHDSFTKILKRKNLTLRFIYILEQMMWIIGTGKSFIKLSKLLTIWIFEVEQYCCRYDWNSGINKLCYARVCEYYDDWTYHHHCTTYKNILL